MIIIGLTGSFGTGKTTVGAIFRSLGAKVIDADKIARSAIKKGTPVYRKVVEEFGSAILDSAGDIDRTRLARRVFADDGKGELKRLNRIVHPVVIKLIRERMGKAGRCDVVVIDAPLLIEANLAGIVDKLVVVKSSREKQMERCKKRFRMDEKDVLKRIEAQMPLEEKMGLADFVVDNDGTKAETRMKVLGIWRKIWR